MKSAIYFAVFIAICFTGYCYGQEPTITINEFKAQELKDFDKEGEIITPKKLQDGFTLKIKKTSSITKAELTKGGNFAETNLPTATFDDKYNKIYKGVKITAKTNDIIEIQIQKNGEVPVIVKLKVGEDNDGLKNDDCIQRSYSISEKRIMNLKNNFGEDITSYNKKTIVYLFDFNYGIGEGVSYRITKKNNELVPEPIVNFSNETLTPGKNVKFKIININKFMYDVSIADSVIHFDSEPPALFTEYFLGDKAGLLGSLMEAFSDYNKAQASDNTKELIVKINKFLTDYTLLKSVVVDAYNACQDFPLYQIDYNCLLKQLTEINVEKGNVERKLNKIISNDGGCKVLVKQKLDTQNQIKDLDYKIGKLKQSIGEFEANIIILANSIDRIQTEIRALEIKVVYLKDQEKLEKEIELAYLKAELIDKKNELSQDKINLVSLKANRDGFENSSETLKNSISVIDFDIAKTCPEVAAMQEVLEESKNLFQFLPPEDSLIKLVKFINIMPLQHNSCTRDINSLNGNMLDITINIVPKESVSRNLSLSKDDPQPIQIPIIGRPFVSFSSGSFITIGSHLQNKTYAWQETIGNNNTANPDSFTLVESGYTVPPMGFCALGNLQWKLSRSFGLGGSFGVGLSIEKSPRLAYLGGVSLLFGDLRQLAITGGLAGMQVNKLTNNFQTITENQIIYTSKPDIQYYNEFKVGSFISLTYTPFKVYKTKTVKSQNK